MERWLMWRVMLKKNQSCKLANVFTKGHFIKVNSVKELLPNSLKLSFLTKLHSSHFSPRQNFSQRKRRVKFSSSLPCLRRASWKEATDRQPTDSQGGAAIGLAGLIPPDAARPGLVLPHHATPRQPAPALSAPNNGKFCERIDWKLQKLLEKKKRCRRKEKLRVFTKHS